MARLRILIVDDSRSARFAVSRMLRPYPVDVVEAKSAAEAMDAIRQQRPDAVLMDHVMPDRDGLEALADIRGDDALRDLPVFICSSHDGDDFLAEARGKGATDLLGKPPAPDHLDRIIKGLQDEIDPPVVGAETVQAPPAPMKAKLQPHAHSVRSELPPAADAPGTRALAARLTRLEESTASLAATLKKTMDRVDQQERALASVTDRVLDEIIRALTELRERRK